MPQYWWYLAGNRVLFAKKGLNAPLKDHLTQIFGTSAPELCVLSSSGKVFRRMRYTLMIMAVCMKSRLLFQIEAKRTPNRVSNIHSRNQRPKVV